MWRMSSTLPALTPSLFYLAGSGIVGWRIGFGTGDLPVHALWPHAATDCRHIGHCSGNLCSALEWHTLDLRGGQLRRRYHLGICYSVFVGNVRSLRQGRADGRSGWLCLQDGPGLRSRRGRPDHDRRSLHHHYQCGGDRPAAEYGANGDSRALAGSPSSRRVVPGCSCGSAFRRLGPGAVF